MNATKYEKQLRLAVIVAMSGMFLTGCANNLPASVAGGECKIFVAPDYAIRGKTRADQNWIDDTEEYGIAGCGWARPKAQPVAMPVKALPKATVIMKENNVLAPIAPLPPLKKKHWWQRKVK